MERPQARRLLQEPDVGGCEVVEARLDDDGLCLPAPARARPRAHARTRTRNEPGTASSDATMM